MSYSHYWSWETSIMDGGRFAQWSRDVGILLEHYPSYAHWSEENILPGWWKNAPPDPEPENWSRHKICGPSGTGEPVISETEVAFNGAFNEIEAINDSYEPFRISLQDVLQPFPYGNSCKTSLNPYDLLVTAALVRLTHYFPEIQVSSDGGFGGLQQGTQFCCDVFGMGVNPALQMYKPNSSELLENIYSYPNLHYMKYIVAWYQHLHTSEAVRYATLEERVLIKSSSVHDPEHPQYFDIINDSSKCVWIVKTGRVFNAFSKAIHMWVMYGSDFPSSDDYIAFEAIRLIKQFGGTHYQLGTPERDASLKNAACLSHTCTIYFHDGTIMLVRIPSQVTRKNGLVIPVQGIIEYSIVQPETEREAVVQIVDKEEYQVLYKTTDPRI